MAYINVDEVYILDNTGLQVDMATDIPFVDAGFSDDQKAQARKNISAGGTNPNLLDNPWFTIRQRGDGPFNGAGFTVDRWSISGSSSTLTANSGYISLNMMANAVLIQRIGIELALGVPYTASVMDKDGTINSATFTPTATENIFNLGSFICVFDARATYAPNYRFYIYKETAWTADLKAAKLELGSVSTLANDTPPDYGTELLKCQRYFRRLSGTIYYLLMGFSVDATKADIPMPLGAHAFAKTPNITMVGTHQVRYNGTIYTVSSMSVQENAEHIVTALRMTTNATGMTGYTPVYYGANGSTSYIDFSADL